MCPTKKRSAFTLVELLVVIGIIALLISILLPALSKAQQAARLTMCLSNMRSLGQATGIYEAENKGAFPPMGADKYINHIDAPHVWSLFKTDTAMPVASNIRYCPEIATALPFQDLTGPNADGKPCYTTRVHVSYLYNYYLGGLDNRNGPGIVTGDGLALATAFKPCTYKSIPMASETMLFMEYPQLVVVCAGYESNGMDRGMVNVSAYSLYSGNVSDPLMITVKNVQHQVFYAVAPVHNRRPTHGAFKFLNNTVTGAQVPAMQGNINICYCDGSVRTVFVQQGQGPGLNNNVTRGDSPWDLAMGTQNGAFYPGSSAPIEGTRYVPYRHW